MYADRWRVRRFPNDPRAAAWGCAAVVLAAMAPLLLAVPQADLHGGVFFEAEDFDERVPQMPGFASPTGEKAAGDGVVLYRFHKGTLVYRVRIPRKGRWRAWLRYGAPGEARIHAAFDPDDLNALPVVELPSTGGCVGPGVWAWRVVAEADLDEGEHRLALGSAALRPDCLFLTDDPRVRPDDRWLAEVRWPLGPRLPAFRHERRITRHPTWLRSAWRLCYAHAEWNRSITIEEWCKRAAEAGAQVVIGAGEIPAGMLNGRLHPVPADRDAFPNGYEVRYDWVRRYTEAAHKYGLRFVCYVNADRTLDPLLVEHPEWRQVRYGGMPWPGWGSWQSAYRKAFNDRLVRIARESGFDGIFIDMPFAGPPGGDYSRWMVEAFKKKTGVDPPRKPRPEDPLFQRWIDFQVWTREEWLLDLTEALHEVDPEIAVIINQTRGWIFNFADRQFLSTRVARCVDGLNEEVGWELYHAWHRPWAWSIQEQWQNLFLRCRTRPGWSMMWHVTFNMPEVDLRAHAFAMMANGVAPAVTTGGNWPEMQRIWEYIRQCEPCLTDSRLVPWAALHFSEQTLARLANREGDEATSAYVRGLFGFFRACLEEHLPIEIVTDDDLADPARLQRYAVLVLADSACLTDRQAAALEEYVRNGGGLTATYRTGCFDEFGVRRPQPALSGLFGVAQGDAVQGVLWTLRLRDVRHPLLDDPDIARAGVWSQGLIEPRQAVQLYAGPAERKVGAVFVGKPAPDAIIAPMCGASRRRRGGIRPSKGQRLCAFVARQVGKGRVVFFPLAVGNAYYGFNHPAVRALIAGALRWSASTAPPIETNAPAVVQTVLYRKGDQRIVHLLNDVSSFGRAGPPNPEGYTGFRDEVLPIHDVTVVLPGRFGRVRKVPGNETLPAQVKEGRTTVRLPVLGLHAILEFDPAPDEQTE